MNLSGLILPCTGWSQRSQGLESGDLARVQSHDGLVLDGELVAGDRALEVRLELETVAHGQVHARLEQRPAAAAVLLGPVHRQVGVAQEVGRLARRAPGERDPDARTDEDPVALDGERVPEPLDDLLGRFGRRLQRAVLLEEHGELVAAEAGHDGGAPQARPRAAGRRPGAGRPRRRGRGCR